MRKQELFLFFWLALKFIYVESVSAQAPVMGTPLSNLIPPSPQAYSIGKYGSNPIGLHTGTVKFSLPMFNFDAGGYQIPISLSYSSNGVKVDEIASRVGLQWRMDFTGVINRTIMGKPENGTGPQQFRPITHDVSNYEFYNYLKVASAAVGGIFQYDQFSYSFPGYSGKFIFTEDSVVQIPHNNLIIRKTSHNDFLIIAPDGTRYEFGGGYTETNHPVQFLGNGLNCSTESYVDGGITSWHLRKITLANGFDIEYDYTRVPPEYENNIASPENCVTYLSGINQTYTFLQFGNEHAVIDGATLRDELTGIPGFNFYVNTCVQQMGYNYILLNAIKTKNGEVRFFYSTREDVIGERKLDSIHLVDRSENVIKRWGLGYTYPANSSREFDTKYLQGQVLQDEFPELRKRLVLKSAQDLSLNSGQVHRFDYHNIESLPPRLSYAQDYWGYFNGQKNEYLFPANTFGGLYNPDGVEHGGDRDGRFEYTQIGMLKRALYPTGGYTEFTYEPSQIGYRNYRPFYDTLVITGSVSSANPIFETNVLVNGYGAGPKVKIEPIAPKYNAPPPGGFQEPSPDSILVVRMFDPNIVLYQPDWFYHASSIWSESNINRTKISTNTTHQLKLQVMNQYDSGVNFRITIYNPRNEQSPILPTGYGLKVKEIVDHDNFGNKYNHRRFNYHFFKAPEIKDFQYNLRSPTDGWLFNSAFNGLNWVGIRLHSSSNHALYSNELNSFSYPAVTEHFIDKNGDSTGGIQYRFYTVLQSEAEKLSNRHCDQPFGGLDGNPTGGPDTSLNKLGAGNFPCIPVPGATASNTDLHDGAELERISYYLDQSKNRVIKSRVRNHYSIDPHFQFRDTLYNLQRVGQEGSDPGVKYYNSFAISRYYVYSNWMHLDSTETINYEGLNDSLKMISRFTYGNPRHKQPTRIEQLNSRGQNLRTEFKFPEEFSGIEVYDEMVDRNIITPVIEQIEYNQTTGYELSRARMNFMSWHNNKFFLPATIQKSINGNELYTDASLQAYDTLGNILQFTGADGLINSIIWGYGGMYPVAKIVGRSYEDIISSSGIKVDILNSVNATEQAITAELAKLRNLSGVVVATYTYKPLMGVSTETDTNGRTTFYEYDKSGRLIHLKDQKGNIVKKYCYNYAGQQVNCNGSQ